MRGKQRVAEILGFNDFGVRTDKSKKIEGLVPAIVKKADGEKAYAVVKWDDKRNAYRIISDPVWGRSIEIVSVFERIYREEEPVETKTEYKSMPDDVEKVLSIAEELLSDIPEEEPAARADLQPEDSPCEEAQPEEVLPLCDNVIEEDKGQEMPKPKRKPKPSTQRKKK